MHVLISVDEMVKLLKSELLVLKPALAASARPSITRSETNISNTYFGEGGFARRSPVRMFNLREISYSKFAHSYAAALAAWPSISTLTCSEDRTQGIYS